MVKDAQFMTFPKGKVKVTEVVTIGAYQLARLVATHVVVRLDGDCHWFDSEISARAFIGADLDNL